MGARRRRSDAAIPSRRARGRRVAVATAVVGALVLPACGAFSEADDEGATLADVERENRAEGDVEGAVGDELEVYGDVVATVTSVERVESFSEIDSRGYVVATVSMRNTTNEAIDYDRSDWQIEKPDGTVSNTANVSTEPQLQDDKIPAGGTVEGTVIYTVGELEGQFAILFSPASLRPEDELEIERAVWVFQSSPGDAG